MVTCSPSVLSHDPLGPDESAFVDMAPHQDQLSIFGAEPAPSRGPLPTLRVFRPTRSPALHHPFR